MDTLAYEPVSAAALRSANKLMMLDSLLSKARRRSSLTNTAAAALTQVAAARLRAVSHAPGMEFARNREYATPDPSTQPSGGVSAICDPSSPSKQQEGQAAQHVQISHPDDQEGAENLSAVREGVLLKPVLRLRARATTIGASHLAFQPDAPRRGSIPSMETLPEDVSQMTITEPSDQSESQLSKPPIFFNSKRSRAITAAAYYNPPQITLQPPESESHSARCSGGQIHGLEHDHLEADRHYGAHKRLSIQNRRRSTSLPLAPLVIPDAATAPDFAVDYAAFVQKQSTDY